MIQSQNRGHTKANLDRVEVNPKVMMGKPVIKGTHIPVDLVLRKLGKIALDLTQYFWDEPNKALSNQRELR